MFVVCETGVCNASHQDAADFSWVFSHRPNDTLDTQDNGASLQVECPWTILSLHSKNHSIKYFNDKWARNDNTTL